MPNKNTAVSDAEIVAALLQHGTVKQAAQAVGIAPRTLYDRMKEKEFRGLYAAAKNDIFRSAVFNINAKLSNAIEAVADIMNDPENNPAVRLQAAQTILNNAGKFAQRLTNEEREAREEAQIFGADWGE